MPEQTVQVVQLFLGQVQHKRVLLDQSQCPPVHRNKLVVFLFLSVKVAPVSVVLLFYKQVRVRPLPAAR
jgi:hypothetical protein